MKIILNGAHMTDCLATQVLQIFSLEMFIDLDSIRSHIKKFYEKLHVNSKSEAVAKAFKDNIVG